MTEPSSPQTADASAEAPAPSGAPTQAPSPLQRLTQAEPVALYGGTGTLLSLVIDVITALGIPLDSTAKLAVILVVSVLGPVAGMVIARSHVVSPATLAELIAVLEEADAEIKTLRPSAIASLDALGHIGATSNAGRHRVGPDQQ